MKVHQQKKLKKFSKIKDYLGVKDHIITGFSLNKKFRFGLIQNTNSI